MKKWLLFFIFACCMTMGSAFAEGLQIGFVNFKTCVEKSKQGQQEKNSFDALKNQMTETLEKAGKELQDLAQKLHDPDYMDGLSPAAEEELKKKFTILNQEFSRYQNQYYQLLNQANYKMLQVMHELVSGAAEKIREREKLIFIFNEESAFAYSPAFDYTTSVIQEMDKVFEKKEMNQHAAAR
jgi:outer membrane protein